MKIAYMIDSLKCSARSTKTPAAFGAGNECPRSHGDRILPQQPDSPHSSIRTYHSRGASACDRKDSGRHWRCNSRFSWSNPARESGCRRYAIICQQYRGSRLSARLAGVPAVACLQARNIDFNGFHRILLRMTARFNFCTVSNSRAAMAFAAEHEGIDLARCHYVPNASRRCCHACATTKLGRLRLAAACRPTSYRLRGTAGAAEGLRYLVSRFCASCC